MSLTHYKLISNRFKRVYMSLLCVLYNKSIWNGPLAKKFNSCGSINFISYKNLTFLWIFAGKLTIQNFQNSFKPRLWPVQAVQNPVKFDKNLVKWQKFGNNYF